jgi:hypothetical protein
MAFAESVARRLPAKEPAYRSVPHNIEAEQALLGAIWSITRLITGFPTSSSRPIFRANPSESLSARA